MRFMSFNIQHCLNYLEQKIDFEIMAETIKACCADVVGLNEVRGAGTDPEYEAQTEILAGLCGMGYYYFAKAINFDGGPYGNAILSRVPILKAETISIPDPDPRGYDGYYESRCILKAELEGGITVLITHLGLNPDEKESAVSAIIENMPRGKCVVMGDFNMTADDEIIRPIYSFMNDASVGFCDEKLSFPSVAPHCKIDYIFTSRDVSVVFSDIPDIVASDHRPHFADLNFKM